MREWSHDQLHTLIDADSQLTELSEKVHATPTPDSLADARDQKLRMMEIYARAVACHNLASAQNGIIDVFEYLATQFPTYTAFRSGTGPAYTAEIAKITERYRREKLCHTPNGNNYVCFCNDNVDIST